MSEKRKLSDCVRPTVEAAPWVIDAILELESKLSDHIKREVMLRDKIDWLRRYGCKDDLAFRVAQDALAATDDLKGLRLCHAEPCRDDGRCQYAIDHGAEGLGHCPEGKCCMPLYRAWEPTK